MKRAASTKWKIAAICVAAIGLVVLVGVDFRTLGDAGPMPRPIDFERDDFMIFSGDYEAQLADGFRPRSDVRPLGISPPVDWNMDPFDDRNWRFQLHSWRMLNPIWAQWYGRDWERLQAEIMPWIQDWYDYHVNKGNASDFEWYDMAAGYRAQHLAMLLQLQRQGLIKLNPRQSMELAELARLHVEKLRDPEYITHGNHAIIQLHGLRLLCLAWLDQACRGEEAYTAKLMQRLLDTQFGEQGVHTENSPGYHLFALSKFSSLRPELYPPIAEEFDRVLNEARDVAPWFTRPDGSISAMGDSAGSGARFPPAAVPDCTTTTPAGTCVISRDLTAGGYAIIRSAPGAKRSTASMLIVGGASVPPGSHDHADELGFELFEGGRLLFSDAGKYSYNKDAWRNYFISDRAHNVVGIQGRAFAPHETLTRGSMLERMGVDGNIYVVEGYVERADGFTHRRVFRYQPSESLVVSDEVDVPDGVAPVSYWHFAADLDVEESGGNIQIFDNDVAIATMALVEGNCEAVVVNGRGGDWIQGWISESYLRKVPAAVVEYRCAEGVTRIVTRIDFVHTGGAKAVASAKPSAKGDLH